MRAIHRWGLVALAGALVVLVPFAVRALPVSDSSISATDLLARIQQSDEASYSGMVDVQGHLGLPVTDRFTDIADLLGGETRMRVWWRSSDQWRVDKLLVTGEQDLFHQGRRTVSWDYERTRAQVSRDPDIRLPRDSDLLPPALAHRILTGVTPDEVSRLPARRVAGHDAVGLRVRPNDNRTSVDHADLWADPSSGLVLALEVYGKGSTQSALTTTFTSVDLATPPVSATAFHKAAGLPVTVDHVLDIADAANQYAPLLPPPTVDGLPRSSSSRGAVGVYGKGLTQVLAVPLQGRDAGYLSKQMRASGAREVQGQLLLRAGPLGVVVTISHGLFEFAWIVTGTLTDDSLVRAAVDLDQGTRYRR